MLSPSVVTLAAFLDSINPCAISVLLLSIGFLFSLKRSRKQIVIVGLVYILAIFVTYVLIGLGILGTLSVFGIPKLLSKAGALILITTSVLSLMDSLIPNFPIHLAIPSSTKPMLAKLIAKSTVPAFILLGVLVGLFEFPCTGGPYLLILTLLHDQSSYSQGFAYLLYYNLIFVLPLVVVLFLTSSTALLSRVEKWRKANGRRYDIISSLASLILAIIILFVSL